MLASTLKRSVPSTIWNRVLAASCTTWVHCRLVYGLCVKQLRDGCNADLICAAKELLWTVLISVLLIVVDLVDLGVRIVCHDTGREHGRVIDFLIACRTWLDRASLGPLVHYFALL